MKRCSDRPAWPAVAVLSSVLRLCTRHRHDRVEFGSANTGIWGASLADAPGELASRAASPESAGSYLTIL